MSSNQTTEELTTRIKDIELKLAEYEKGEPHRLISEEFRRLANRSRDIIYRYDLTTHQFVFFNKTGLEFYGIDVQNGRETTVKRVLVSNYQEDWDKVRKAQNESLTPGSMGGEVEYRQIRPDGSLHWMHDRWSTIKDETGNPVAIEGIVRDITVQKQAEEELREREIFIRAVMDSLPIGVAVNTIDPLLKFEYMNDNYPKFYQTTREVLSEPDAFWPTVYEEPEFRDELKKRVLDDIASGDPARMSWVDIPITRKGDKTTYITAMNIPIPGKRLMVSTVWDVTDRKQAEDALQIQNKTFSQVLNGLDALVYVVDMKTYEIVFINTYGQNIWGDIGGKICWQTIQTGHTGPCEFCTNSKLIGPDGNPTEGVVWEFQNTVNKRWYDCRDRAIYWPDGRIVRMEIATDITDRKCYEEKLKHFAIHDQLTGLLNRHSLEDILIRTIAKAKRGAVSSILYMDLDNFKDVNDSVGHGTGDEVLITLAGLLKNAVRTEDIIFRLGGDEFAVLLDGMVSRESLSAAERLRSIVEAHRFDLEGRVFPLSLSIGIIEIDGTLVTGELMSQADKAMYRAKAQGKNRVVMA